MSEACLGLEPKGWTYVASLIKDGRATGVNVYIDEPYPQIAENAAGHHRLLVLAHVAVQVARQHFTTTCHAPAEAGEFDP